MKDTTQPTAVLTLAEHLSQRYYRICEDVSMFLRQLTLTCDTWFQLNFFFFSGNTRPPFDTYMHNRLPVRCCIQRKKIIKLLSPPLRSPLITSHLTRITDQLISPLFIYIEINYVIDTMALHPYLCIFEK